MQQSVARGVFGGCLRRAAPKLPSHQSLAAGGYLSGYLGGGVPAGGYLLLTHGWEEQGWRPISILVPSLLIDGARGSTEPAPAVSLHFVKHSVTMTDGASLGCCCCVCLSRIFAVLAAQSRGKDKCSCVETLTRAP